MNILHAKLPAYTAIPILLPAVAMTFLQIPFIGGLLMWPLFPIAEWFDLLVPGDFTVTGEHAKVDMQVYSTIRLFTWQAWLFYISFFSLLGVLCSLFIYYKRQFWISSKSASKQ
jgi:hypothetical protein